MSVAHLTFPTRDVNRTTAFLEEAFGYVRGPVPDHTPVEALRLDVGGGQQIHVIQVDKLAASPTEHEFGRHVALFHPRDDFDRLKGHLQARGAELIEPLQATPFDRFFFREPINGYVLEVIDESVAARAVRERRTGSVPLVQVDAFADGPFTGNPAAVCVLPEPRDAVWMQQVAREMNLSETAFVVRRDGGFDLRWFTPSVEVALCGHATLASAHVLWQEGHLRETEPARFHTRSGLLTATRDGRWIELDFPATPAEPADAPEGLVEALGATAVAVAQSRFDYLVELGTEAAVRDLRPDHVWLRRLPVRGVMVTSRATTPGWDFVSRFFAPGSGIDEDPVTGSAHCCLTPYWSARLGRSALVARQVSSRGGTLHVRLDGERVRLRGQAVTVLRGELMGTEGTKGVGS